MPTIRELAYANRSCRRFDQSHRIDMAVLEELVDIARVCPSAANLQPLKYAVVNEDNVCARVFENLFWAAYLKDWAGPEEGERPSAYIVILHDKSVSPGVDCDHGITAQTMLLAAREKGLAGCMLGAVRKPEVMQALNLPETLNILLVLALGKPAEDVVIESVGADGDIRYYRGDDERHHVPKRALSEILLRK
ncbi:MAG: nitroreductase family protein [Desulfatibacillaceae bacterium]